MRTLKTALVAFAFFIITPFSAQAEEALADPDEGVTPECEADTLYQVAEEALGTCESTHATSIRTLIGAYERCNEYTLIQYVGRCFLLADEFCEAERYYRRYRDLAVEHSDPFLTEVIEGTTGLARLNQEIERLHVRCEESRAPDLPDPPDPDPDPPPVENPPPPPTQTLHPPRRGVGIAGWVIGGIGLSSLITAVPLWGVAWSEYNANPHERPSESYAGDAMGISGGILTAVGVVLLIVHYVQLRRFQRLQPAATGTDQAFSPESYTWNLIF